MEEARESPEFSVEQGIRLTDIEERQRLLKDRILLIGETLMRERDKISKETQEMKREIIIIKEENNRIKEILERMTEQMDSAARKEELLIIQKQIDLLRRGEHEHS